MGLPNIHIIGIQGSGKGTQASLLVEQYNLLYLGSGNMFRERAAKGDRLGTMIGAEMHAGHLLPDAYLYHTVIDALAEHPYPNGVIGDGIIRTIEQHEHLAPVWKLAGLDTPLLINLVLDEKTALKRIEHRAEQGVKTPYSGKVGYRTDDNPRAIEERFAIFKEMTQPVIKRFDSHDRCIHVDAMASPEVVFAEIRQKLEMVYPNLYVTH
jgi:adenylate kinase